MYAIDKLNFDEESNFMPHARALTQLVVAFQTASPPNAIGSRNFQPYAHPGRQKISLCWWEIALLQIMSEDGHSSTEDLSTSGTVAQEEIENSKEISSEEFNQKHNALEEVKQMDTEKDAQLVKKTKYLTFELADTEIYTEPIFQRCTFLEDFPATKFEGTFVARPANTVLQIGDEVFVCSSYHRSEPPSCRFILLGFSYMKRQPKYSLAFICDYAIAKQTVEDGQSEMFPDQFCTFFNVCPVLHIGLVPNGDHFENSKLAVRNLEGSFCSFLHFVKDNSLHLGQFMITLTVRNIVTKEHKAAQQEKNIVQTPPYIRQLKVQVQDLQGEVHKISLLQKLESKEGGKVLQTQSQVTKLTQQLAKVNEELKASKREAASWKTRAEKAEEDLLKTKEELETTRSKLVDCAVRSTHTSIFPGAQHTPLNFPFQSPPAQSQQMHGWQYPFPLCASNNPSSSGTSSKTKQRKLKKNLSQVSILLLENLILFHPNQPTPAIVLLVKKNLLK